MLLSLWSQLELSCEFNRHTLIVKCSLFALSFLLQGPLIPLLTKNVGTLGEPCLVKAGFHMIVKVGDASPRQARGHTGDGCVEWKHFLSDVADQTGTVRGCIEKVNMSLKPGFHMIIAVIVSICRRLIGDTSLMCCSRSPTVTIIWKPGFSFTKASNIYNSKC